MYKLAVIGKKNKIIFFQALGIEVFSIREAGEIERAFKDIKKAGNFGIVFIDSQYSKEANIEAQKIKAGLPVVLNLPLSYKKEETTDGLKNIIKRAIGTEKITIK